MRVIITGATGMIGGLILEHCLNSNTISEIVVLTRRPLEIKSDKINELIVDDFGDLSSLTDHFKNVDIAYYCIGAYSGTVSDDKFKLITYDLTVEFADRLYEASPSSTFTFLSGSGADSKAKSRVSFARYKGMAENHLKRLDFENLFIFRPAYIFPVEQRQEPNSMYSLMRAIYPLIKLFGKGVSIKSTELAEAMFMAPFSHPELMILENKDIFRYLGSIKRS